MPQGIKKSNEYQKMMSTELYAKTPKSVFAAIVVSYFYNHEQKETIEEVDNAIKHEWEILYLQGIIPQKPF